MMDALTVEQVPTADLATFKGNPRRGDVKTIAASLRTNGQYRAIVVNRGTHTGRPMEVLAGNHTLMAARDLGWDTIAAHVIDVDEDRAKRIVLADNRTAEVGTFNTDALTELLQNLPDLDGTGYDTSDLEDLLKADDDIPKDSGAEDEYHERFELVVECASEADQEALFLRLSNEGMTCRLLTL